jgi:predicted  nucleic acid-binding Zn-ribbon protein
VANFREILQKTEQERYHIEHAKQLDTEFYTDQIAQKDSQFKNIMEELEAKINLISEKDAYIMSKELDLSNITKKYEQAISTIRDELANTRDTTNNVINENK